MLSTAACAFAILSSQAGYAASQQKTIDLAEPQLEQMEAESETSTVLQGQDDTDQMAKNSNGRRCRWVKGIGLVCDGGQFGTFTL